MSDKKNGCHLIAYCTINDDIECKFHTENDNDVYSECRYSVWDNNENLCTSVTAIKEAFEKYKKGKRIMGHFDEIEWVTIPANEYKLLPYKGKARLIVYNGQQFFVPKSISMICKDDSIRIQKWYLEKQN